MTRTLDQILTDEQIEVSERLIRTREFTIRVADSWMLQQFDWPDWSAAYPPETSTTAIGLLVASLGTIAWAIPSEVLWPIPLAAGAAIGSAWSLVRSLRRRRPASPQPPNLGIMFSLGSSEGAATIFTSSDENEVRLLRQGLEQKLLPSRAEAL